MDRLQKKCSATLVVLMAVTIVAAPRASETFKATATMTTAAGSKVTAPISVTVERTTPQREADTLVAAFKSGGAAGLRKALEALPSTGSIQIGGSPAARTYFTLERTTDKGRLLTIMTDKPILFAGAGLPNAKPKAGYDFALLDLEVGSAGIISGTLAPAARITIKNGAFVVEDYSSESIRITPGTREGEK